MAPGSTGYRSARWAAAPRLPSWVYRQPALPPGVARTLREEEYLIPIRDSIATVRGPVEVDVEYTTAEDASAPRDGLVTQAIQRFDPHMIPLWGRYTFIVDNLDGNRDRVTFGRHVIGRYVSNRRTPALPFKLSTHPGFTGPLPNSIELIWDGRIFGDFDRRGRELPGPFLPWDWRLYKFASDAWNFKQSNDVSQLTRKLVIEPQEALRNAAAARRAAQVDTNQRLRKEVSALLARVSEPELRDYFMKGKFRTSTSRSFAGLGLKVG